MQAQEFLNLSIDTAEAFERLAGSDLDLKLWLAPETREQFRDTFFDTADRALRARGMICCMRVQSGYPPMLSLTIEDYSRGQGLVIRKSFESLPVHGGVFETLKGNSEPARRMRALVDPDAVRPVAAVEVERRLRQARARWVGRTRFDVSLDTLRVEGGGISRTFYELNILRRRAGRPDLSTLASLLQQQPGVTLPKSDTLGRIFEFLAAGVEDLPREAMFAGKPAIRVFLMNGDRVALMQREGDIHLPGMKGAGEAQCSALVRQYTQEPVRLRLITTVPADRERVRLEVWAAQLESANVQLETCAWVPFYTLLHHVGRPGLRDRLCVAAVAAFARSQLLRELPVRGCAACGELPESLIASSPRGAHGSDRFLNPEVSFLDFNVRVLELASDVRIPLLERVRYLAILSANLDEFFMVQVASIMQLAREENSKESDDGFTPGELLLVIAARVRALLGFERKCQEDLFAALDEAGIHFRKWEQLPAPDRLRLREYFDAEIFPLLTPRALTVSPGHPFPHLPGLGLSVAAVLRDPAGRRMHFSHMRVPDNLPRYLPADGPHSFIMLEDVIVANANALFPGFDVDSVHALRVVRSAVTKLDEEHASDLADAVAREVRERPFRPVVGIEVSRDMPQIARELLLRELRQEEGPQSTLSELNLYGVDGPLQLRDLTQIADLDLPKLRFPKFTPRQPIPADRSIFAVVSEGDLLVHRPYDSFEHSVLRLFEDAAGDPAVLSIKVGLYRAARDSRVVEALVRAANAGKEVMVFVELKARFDEASNLSWLQRLRTAGIPVVYGLVGYKMHGKVALVARREGGQIKRYAHIGTGNYNERTARVYTDLGLLTANAELTADLANLFNALTGTAKAPAFAPRKLLLAPSHMLERFISLIEREAEHARAGRRARIRAQMNGLTDGEIVRALYAASQAGVQIDLIVRGLCTLRPGVPELSQNIRLISILGRYLEHPRIFAFHNDGAEEYYIGSADWRPRNLRRRIEVVTPIETPQLKQRLDGILTRELADEGAWELGSDGVYRRRAGGAVGSTAQAHFAGMA